MPRQRNPFIEPLEQRLVMAVGTLSEQIIIDQFGWRTTDKKYVLFADPINGQNFAIAYTPGTTFQVRNAATDVVAFTGSTASWRSGTVHADSGDKVWTGDFSSFTSPGEYYIYDPANNLRSYNFVLSDNAYADVLKTSIRTYYYQRMGTAIPAQYGGNWTHAIDHTNDAHALLWQNGHSVAGTQRDVSGGWMDAGDYNKYVPFTTSPLWNLLTAYEWNPQAFGDATNIPESGNGVPDVLDEFKYETDWLLKMQTANGSVLNRVSNATYNAGNADPSTDTQARYYTAATTWATASFAASLAHASRVFIAFDPAYAATLLTAAQNAWSYLQTPAGSAMNPSNGSDGGANLASASAGADAGYDLRLRILASAELFKTTGDTVYRSYFDAHYKDAASADNGFQPIAQGRLDPSAAVDLNHAYVTYYSTPGATASVNNDIRTAIQGVNLSWFVLGEYLANDDPYRGFMWSGHYTWGSNQIKSDWANLLLYAYKLNVSPANNAKYLEAAEEYLHYFHGRNPLSYVYLSNMGDKGANLGGDKSPLQFYHSWFADGSAKYDGASSLYGPAPGYLVGGPNQYYSGALTPPKGQPPMKAFVDWNTASNASWEVTEPAIYYQASYSLLLSFFADTPTPTFIRNDGGAAFSITGSPGAEALTVSGGAITLTDTAWLTHPGLSLSVTNGGKVTLSSPQRFSNVSIGFGSQLDLKEQSLLIDYTGASPASTVIRRYLQVGRSNGAWTGTGGIITSLAQSNPNRAIGYAEAADIGLTTFLNQPVDTTAILLQYTSVGDANLNGKLDPDDLVLTDRGLAKHGINWLAGDFDYNGNVNPADYDLLYPSYITGPTAPGYLSAPLEAVTELTIPTIIPAKKSHGRIHHTRTSVNSKTRTPRQIARHGTPIRRVISLTFMPF